MCVYVEIVFLFVFLFLIILAGFLFFYFFVYRKIDKIIGVKPLKISVAQLKNEYASDENTAREKFNSKILEVTGRVSKIIYNGNEYIMTLENDFNCYFKYANFPIVLIEGQSITIVGIFYDDGNLYCMKKCFVNSN